MSPFIRSIYCILINYISLNPLTDEVNSIYYFIIIELVKRWAVCSLYLEKQEK